jgi:hypothetical protein
MQRLLIGDHSAAVPGLPASSLPTDGALMHAAADRLPRGLMIFDADARVLACNEAARRTVQAHPSLELVPTLGPSGRIAMRLLAHGASHQVGIEQAVTDCGLAGLDACGMADGSSKAVRTVLIRWPPGGPGAGAPPRAAARTGDPGRAGGDGAGGARLARRPDPPAAPRCPAAQRAVRPERRLGACRRGLLRVDSVKEAARALGISHNTVKTHLALVYERTGCTRQSQLVRLLMALADGCSLPDSPSTSGTGG